LPHCLSGFRLETSPFHLQPHKTKPYLLAGTPICAVCGANLIARVVRDIRFDRCHDYGSASHARRGTSVCPNRTLLPQTAVARELLEILQPQILTPITPDQVLAAVNARLPVQATVARPRVRELQRALTRVTREIANDTRAIGKGDFSLPDQALGAAEQRRSALQAELARRDGNQPAVLQLPLAALEGHLQGLTEKLRSGV
jgi:hypothetical protein